MKKLILVAFASLALSTTACTANQALQSLPVVGDVCTIAEGTLIDDKVLYAANALYNVPAHAYVTANRDGQLTPAVKAVLKPKLLAMYRLLQAVTAAKGTVNCDYASMQMLHAEVSALLPNRE